MPEAQAPEAYILLFDAASATPQMLGATLDQVFRRASVRPGSPVRAWVATHDSDGAVVELARAVSPVLSTRAEQRHPAEAQRRWVEGTRSAFMERIAPRLTPPRVRRSLAAALSAIALQVRGDGELPLQYVVASDGYDPALTTPLCGREMRTDLDSMTLAWQRWFEPHLFQRAHLHLSFFNYPSSECLASPPLLDTVARSLWSQALHRAGAEQVLIEGGGVHFTDEPFAFAHDNGFRFSE